MRVDIKDGNALSGVRPPDVLSYLRARGWSERGRSNGTWASFVREDFEIAVPLTTHLRDFAHRIADAIRTLELVEERDQVEILADLSVTSDDVIRIRIPDADDGGSTLPLERAARIATLTYDLILAAACAAVQPAPCYAAGKPRMALDYMRNVRMGQTQRGGFALTALSRVSPGPTPNEEPSVPGIPKPFERQVTEKLAVALAFACSAKSNALPTDDPTALDTAIDRGVSANLCDTLAGIGTWEDGWRDFEIALSWAISRPIRANMPTRFRVTASMVPWLQEMARLLRSESPRTAGGA
jgi:hypothetical protein